MEQPFFIRFRAKFNYKILEKENMKTELEKEIEEKNLTLEHRLHFDIYQDEKGNLFSQLNCSKEVGYLLGALFSTLHSKELLDLADIRHTVVTILDVLDKTYALEGAKEDKEFVNQYVLEAWYRKKEKEKNEQKQNLN